MPRSSKGVNNVDTSGLQKAKSKPYARCDMYMQNTPKKLRAFVKQNSCERWDETFIYGLYRRLGIQGAIDHLKMAEVLQTVELYDVHHPCVDRVMKGLIGRDLVDSDRSYLVNRVKQMKEEENESS